MGACHLVLRREGQSRINFSHEAHNDGTQDCGWQACSKSSDGYPGSRAVNHPHRTTRHIPGCLMHSLWRSKDSAYRNWRADLQKTSELEVSLPPQMGELRLGESSRVYS